MRLSIFAIIICISGFQMQAQPTLHSAEMLGYGSIMHLQYLTDFQVIDTTIQGADVLWDFSSLPTSSGADDLFVEIVDPATTPQGSEFPEANYAYKETPLFNYRYFILNESEFSRIGSAVSNQLNFYSDHQTELVFPLTMGTANNDTWASSNSSFGGDYNFQCVGYGKLILPSGTFENVLMVRVLLTELSDLWVYFWYSADNGAILLEYTEGDGFFYPEFGLQLRELDVMVGTTNTNVVDNVIYNNPVASNLTVNLFSDDFPDIQYQMVDVNGQRILFDELKGNREKHQQLHLDMSFLSPGMYFLQLYTDHGSQSCKIIKI